METQGRSDTEGEAVPPSEPAGGLVEQPVETSAPAPEAEPPASAPSRHVFLIVAGVTAGVLLFSLAFFMAGFAAHAMLDDDGGSGSREAAVSIAQSDDPSWGPEDAKVTIEAFSDFQCPYCKKFAEDTLPRLKEEYGNRVHFISRDLPLANIHPVAAKAAEAAGCANDQGVFWEYHDLLYENQESLSEAALTEYAVGAGADESQFSDCLSSREKMAEVLLDVQDAQRQGVNSTPAFVINGMLVSGAQPFELFKALIDQALAAE